MEIKQWLKAALENLSQAGVDYADVRHLDREIESITVRNEQVAGLSRKSDSGFGIRVLHKGSWGFAASARLTEASVMDTATRALEVARASYLTQREVVKLDGSQPQRGSYKSEFEVDPFAVPLDKKLELLFGALKVLRQDKRIGVAEGSMSFFRTDKLFLSTEGAEIMQSILESGAGISATAIGDGELQRRSYPDSHGGDCAARGYEFIESLRLVENAESTREETLALLAAEPCPAGKTDLIITSSQLGLQIHESCGHPTELDRALGTEISYAGGSFLTLDKLGGFRYGSKIVNLYGDATIPGSIGSFGYDDEGVPAQRFPIIKEGIFVGYLTSRETAPIVGGQSSGAMRAQSWNHIPLIRMVNINLEPGEEDLSLDDLVEDTKDGILVSTNKSWSIDDLRLNFQFGCEIGWEIKNGKRVRMLKNPVYTGITPQFWNSCDAICGRSEWRLWGLPNCGKGEPPQTMHVGHGTAPARFRNTEVGVKK